MPKVKPLTENERKDREIIEQIEGKMKLHRITHKAMAAALGISLPTLYRRLDKPDTLTIGEVRIMAKLLPGLAIE